MASEGSLICKTLGIILLTLNYCDLSFSEVINVQDSPDDVPDPPDEGGLEGADGGQGEDEGGGAGGAPRLWLPVCRGSGGKVQGGVQSGELASGLHGS